jgi:ATP-dependent HslUV protease, peptidase subunit HslV
VTTVCVARVGAQLAMASDSLVTFGDLRLPPGYEDNEKIFRIGDTLVGLCGSTAHIPVVRRALAGMPAEERRLHSRDEVFDTFLKLHPMLKEKFFLNTKEEDADPYESSQFTVLLANRSGLYGVYSYREVFEFKRFWAIGSGRSYALGAMHAAAGSSRSARAVVQAGVAAGCEFDRNSCAPVVVRSLNIGAA